jgi:hypothetical protein
MNRRSFLRRTGLTAAGVALWDRLPINGQSASPAWRTFEVTTRVKVLEPRGVTRVWLPTPLAVAPYQKTMGDTYHPGDGTAVMIETNANEPDILGCSWDEGVEPILTLVSRVATTAAAVNLDTPTVPPPADLSAFNRFLTPTRLSATDGIGRATAGTITAGRGTDIEKARAIFAAVIREPASESRAHLAITERFVDVCRSAGIPARTVYGLAVSSENATLGQQCRAETYLAGYGWVPTDLSSRRPTFGSWDAPWVAYNFARDVELRGSRRKPIGYFMYPQGETADGPLDSLDAERFRYSIAVRELAANER